MSPPSVVRGNAATILGRKGGDYVLFLRIEFEINQLKITGFLALIMDLPSIDALRALITDFIARMG
jgi:chemotaxis protein CheC